MGRDGRMFGKVLNAPEAFRVNENPHAFEKAPRVAANVKRQRSKYFRKQITLILLIDAAPQCRVGVRLPILQRQAAIGPRRFAVTCPA